MPLAFLLIGAVLVIVAVRGTHANLGQLLSEDFTGTGAGAGHSFLIWLAAIAGVAALGMIPEMKKPAHLLLALVILAMLISNKGVFAQAQQALAGAIPGVTVNQAQASPTAENLPAAIPVQITGGSSSGGSSGGAAGTAGDVIGTAAKVLPFFGGF